MYGGQAHHTPVSERLPVGLSHREPARYEYVKSSTWRREPERQICKRFFSQGAKVAHEFSWYPHLGDPTIGGWMTVALYFAACLSCWITGGSIRPNHRRSPTDAQIWRQISVLFFLLGINKQLDLQSGLTELGRMIAYSGGWYGQRRTVQAEFIFGLAAALVVAIVVLCFWARKWPKETRLGLIGLTFVLGFVVIRAASFHHFDVFIGSRILGLRWNWVLEMGGISIVIIASEWRRRTSFQLRAKVA